MSFSFTWRTVLPWSNYVIIQENYESYLKMNNGKNLFKSMRTPAVLVSLMIADYICQEFCQMVGLDFLAGQLVVSISWKHNLSCN